MNSVENFNTKSNQNLTKICSLFCFIPTLSAATLHHSFSRLLVLFLYSKTLFYCFFLDALFCCLDVVHFCPILACVLPCFCCYLLPRNPYYSGPLLSILGLL
ncbi:hypothetical protein SLEP1_g23520 [Rubroshorea leprosula]|uniref:Uncharacterized protein n=1 Tax=Rubroshorea leprosula TaxID=152421 RepID=A0AAV5JJV7_9ROSI|nr:hypothetical protein SLEP1_g23520 [Rubroshorea leprosula]